MDQSDVGVVKPSCPYCLDLRWQSWTPQRVVGCDVCLDPWAVDCVLSGDPVCCDLGLDPWSSQGTFCSIPICLDLCGNPRSAQRALGDHLSFDSRPPQCSFSVDDVCFDPWPPEGCFSHWSGDRNFRSQSGSSEHSFRFHCVGEAELPVVQGIVWVVVGHE